MSVSGGAVRAAASSGGPVRAAASADGARDVRAVARIFLKLSAGRRARRRGARAGQPLMRRSTPPAGGDEKSEREKERERKKRERERERESLLREQKRKKRKKRRERQTHRPRTSLMSEDRHHPCACSYVPFAVRPLADLICLCVRIRPHAPPPLNLPCAPARRRWGARRLGAGRARRPPRSPPPPPPALAPPLHPPRLQQRSTQK